jgi:hypothetical protein
MPRAAHPRAADYGKAVAARQDFGALVTQSIQRSRHQAAAGPSSSAPAQPAFDCAMADVVAAAAAATASASASSASTTPSPPLLLPDSLLVDNATAAFFGNASTGPSLAKALQYLATNAADDGAAASSVMAALRKEQEVRPAGCAC